MARNAYFVVVKQQWYIPQNEAKLRSAINGAIAKSINYWYVILRQKLSKWGSIPFYSNLRQRIVHSRTGEPPRRQTGNLYESIQTELDPETLSGRVFTDVPYAPMLELGGFSFSFPQFLKKYTRIRLVNPIRHSLVIGPRPAWRQTFDESMPVVKVFFDNALPEYNITQK